MNEIFQPKEHASINLAFFIKLQLVIISAAYCQRGLLWPAVVEALFQKHDKQSHDRLSDTIKHTIMLFITAYDRKRTSTFFAE